MVAKITTALLALPLFLTSVSAHAYFHTGFVNGVSQGHLFGVRAPKSNSPVEDVTSDAITCNSNLYQPVSSDVIEVKPGDTFGMQWNHNLKGPKAGDSDDPIAASHKGPMMAYMARVDNASSSDGAGLKWFKVAEEGLDTTTGKWGVDTLIANKGLWSFKMPALSPGDYILRGEIIALHSAGSTGGAQFYMSCVGIRVTGSGTCSPSDTVSFPGAYSASDAGILISIYSGTGKPDNAGKAYTIPGPSVVSCASGSGSGSSSSVSASKSVSSLSSTKGSVPSSTIKTVTTTMETTTTTATTISGSVKPTTPHSSPSVTPSSSSKPTIPSSSPSVTPSTTSSSKPTTPSSSPSVTPSTTRSGKPTTPSSSPSVTPSTTRSSKPTTPSSSPSVTPSSSGRPTTFSTHIRSSTSISTSSSSASHSWQSWTHNTNDDADSVLQAQGQPWGEVYTLRGPRGKRYICYKPENDFDDLDEDEDDEEMGSAYYARRQYEQDIEAEEEMDEW